MSKNSKIRYWRDSFMPNTYRVIDEKTWERNMHCMIFRNSVEPAFCVTFDRLHVRLYMQYVSVQMR